jgi:hypothetical protein
MPSDRAHDLSQLRRSQRGFGLPEWVFCNSLSVRGYSPGRPDRRHPWGAASASPEELERSVQERADDETLTPVSNAQETEEPAGA